MYPDPIHCGILMDIISLLDGRFIIHGGIDGYSIIPVYWKAAGSNKADTVLDVFCSAVT